MSVSNKKKPVSFSNLILGGGIQLFEVSTLGQPFEVVKTHMAANRQYSLSQVIVIYYNNILIPD
jgi:hypothetical protein